MGRPNYFDIKYSNLDTKEIYRQSERDALLYDIAKAVEKPEILQTYNQYDDINYYMNNIDDLIQRDLDNRKYEKTKSEKSKIDNLKERYANLLLEQHKLTHLANQTNGFSVLVAYIIFIYICLVIGILIINCNKLILIPITLFVFIFSLIIQLTVTTKHQSALNKLKYVSSELNKLLDEFEKNK